jgi:hypothetical protein
MSRLKFALLFYAVSAAGCALVTHDLGSTRGPRPASGAPTTLAITKKIGPELRSDNPAVRFPDSLDSLEDRVEIAKLDDREICIAMVDYQVPTIRLAARVQRVSTVGTHHASMDQAAIFDP